MNVGGGGWGPTPSASAPPRKTVLGNGDVYGLYSGQFRLCAWYGVCVSVLVCLFGNLHAVMLASEGPAKSRTHAPSWGLSNLFGSLFGYCATGGRLPWWGGLWTPRYHGPPGVTLQEKAGRPMGPSTLRCEFPWEVVVVYVEFLFFVLHVFVCSL